MVHDILLFKLSNLTYQLLTDLIEHMELLDFLVEYMGHSARPYTKYQAKLSMADVSCS